MQRLLVPVPPESSGSFQAASGTASISVVLLANEACSHPPPLPGSSRAVTSKPLGRGIPGQRVCQRGPFRRPGVRQAHTLSLCKGPQKHRAREIRTGFSGTQPHTFHSSVLHLPSHEGISHSCSLIKMPARAALGKKEDDHEDLGPPPGPENVFKIASPWLGAPRPEVGSGCRRG